MTDAIGDEIVQSLELDHLSALDKTNHDKVCSVTDACSVRGFQEGVERI
jgi:hypothetical protein